MSHFSLFGFGRDSLPGDVHVLLSVPGEVEAIAQSIIDSWTKAAARNARIDDGGEIATWAFILVEYHRALGKAPPQIVMEALARVLGLVGPKRREARPSSRVLARLGFPQVDKLSQFFLASALDGEADARGRESVDRLAMLTGGPVPTPRSWVKVKGRLQLSVNWLAETAGVSNPTLREWRAMPVYQRRRAAVCGLALIGTR